MAGQQYLSSAEYPWYEWTVGDEVYQGDVFFDFPLQVPIKAVKAGEKSTDVQVQQRDLVVLSQTCDILTSRVSNLVFCPAYDYAEFVGSARDQWNGARREDLRKGNLPGYHLLNSCEDGPVPFGVRVVDFHEVFGTPLAVVKEHALLLGSRPRLRPPYREHLAQAFARFFMRVGLPVDIPKEKLNL